MLNRNRTILWFSVFALTLGLSKSTEAGPYTKLKEGDGVEVSGSWSGEGIFIARSVEKLAKARRPKLRGTIDKLDRKDSSFVLFGLKIKVEARTLFPARGEGTVGIQALKDGMRLEITCNVSEQGTWTADKIDWNEIKASDKIKGTITRLIFDSKPPDTIEISGLKILVTEETDLYGSARYLENELFGNLTADEGGINFPHLRVGDQLLLSGDYRQTTRLEKRYTLSEVQKDDYQDTEPALRLEAAGNWAPEVQSFLQLRLRKKYTFGTFPNRPSTAESTRFEFQAIQAYLLLRAPAGRKAALMVGKQRVRDQREWLFDEYLDAVRLYFYETQPVVLEASFLPSLFPFQDEKYRTWDDFLFRVRFIPDGKNEANVYMLKRRDSDARNREPVYWGLSYYGRPKRFITGWLQAGLLRGTDKQRDQEAYALDFGATFAATDHHLRPSLTLGYSLGSGDKVSGDSISQEFRQTGYEDNSGRFGGFANFQYYGEVLDPELANLQILTAGAGFRPHRQVSFDAIFHTYRQNQLDNDVRSELIAPPAIPTGLSKDLGWELDFILGIQRILQRVNLAYSFGLFNPGEAFMPFSPDNAILNRINLRIEF
ncbi:MAG: alginate export family protein [candidate division Zixibacteria bacterium]|nr:alginate export family protein [candidate division Zixibacteria bacterium]